MVIPPQPKTKADIRNPDGYSPLPLYILFNKVKIERK
jgi:hypothetical protein